MGAFFTLIGGIKGVAIIILIAALGGWAFMQKKAVEKATLERDQAIVQRDTAGIERDKAVAAARTNEETITRLEQEKETVNEALNSLASAKETNRSNSVTRQVVIQQAGSVPANNAVAAPVLGAIVKEVQDDRDRRRP